METASDYENRMIEAFVGKPEKYKWYKNAFTKFNVNGIDTLKWHWSWWAFFGNMWFLLYRKAYLAALGLFILSVIPYVGLLLCILNGGYGTFFVYKAYRNKKSEIENTISSSDEKTRIETMALVGGYNQWVIWLYGASVALVFLICIIFMVLLGK